MVKPRMPFNIVEDLLGTGTAIPNRDPGGVSEIKPVNETPGEALEERDATPSGIVLIDAPGLDDTTVQESASPEDKADDSDEKQLVVFDLASGLYGLDIGYVREIIRVQNVTKVPGTPFFVEGVINLRGKIVPVIDLRKKLNLDVVEQTAESRIVVVDVVNGQVGVIVDAVTEVLRIPVSSIESSTFIVAGNGSNHMNGIAKIGDKMIVLLDLSAMLSSAA